MTLRVMVTDDVDPDGVAVLQGESSLQVDVIPTLPVPELLERIGNYDAIVGRSATRISAELLQRATRLRVVGRAGVGVDNIAIDTATQLGVAIINAPAGNTIAVAELFFGAVLSLLRHLPRAHESMRAGRWDRSSLIGNELKGRTLAIVGLGRIGGEIAVRAIAFGMDVIAYDPYVPGDRFQSLRVRRMTTLESALGDADIVTIHTPLTDETTGLIGRRELSRIRPGAIVVNLARGGIVDDTALMSALDAGTIRGAVLDVFAREPLASDDRIRSLPNVILTPHIGANTEEAQRNVAVDVCVAVRDALLRDELSRSINVASVSGMPWSELQPAVFVARRAAAVARALLADRGVRAVQRLALRCAPELIGGSEALLAAAAAGVLDGVIESGRLNLINARSIAHARGVELAVAESPRFAHGRELEVALGGGMQEIVVGGIAAPGMSPRLTRIGGFHVDVTPRQTLLILTNNDVPGVIGHVGTCLGAAGVNIAEYHQARLAQGGEALAAISVDGTVQDDVRRKLLDLPDVLSATVVQFGAS